MKILRIILLIIGLLFVISQTYFIIIIATDPKVAADKEHDFWDNYFAPILFLVIGGLFLFITYRINRKIKRKKVMDLIKSLPE
jgi:cell division protein FtsW (lipid II flippase)